MTTDGSALVAQQLVELLQVMSSYADEAAATRAAVDQAVMVLEAEVAALLVDGQVVRSVGFPARRVPVDDLIRVTAGTQEELDVPGAGRCRAIAVPVDGHGYLVLARCDDFTVEEHSLLRGMGRILDLTLRMIRTADSLRRGQRQME